VTVPTSQHGNEQDSGGQIDQEPATSTDATGTDATGTDATGTDATGSDATGTVAAPRMGGIDPSAFAARIPGPVWQGTIALAIYLGLWIFGWTLPLILHARMTLLDQTSQDPNFYVWSLRWWPYAVAHGLNPLLSKEIGAPGGFNMTWTTTVPPLALLASPLTLIAGALRSFNILAAIAPALCAWVAFVACRRLTGNFWAALFGGAVFGFSAYETGHTMAGQLNLSWNLLLPLMVYLVVLWRDQKLSRAWFVGLMALAIVLQFFMFVETFFELTAVLAIGLPVGYALAGRDSRPVMARLARQLGAAWVIAFALVSPYLVYALANYPPGFSRSPATTGLDLASLVVPRPTGAFGIGWLMNYSVRLPSYSTAGYVGLPVLLIALALAIRTWQSKITRFVVIMFVVIVALAVGPSLVIGTIHVGSVPWAKLWFLPVARSALPNRFMLIGSLALAVIVTIWLATPTRSLGLRAARWAVALLAVVAILADVAPTSFDPAAPTDHVPAFFTTGRYRHYIKPGEIVLVISARDNAGMLFQAYTNFYMRIAGGYINMAISQRSDLPPQVIALSHADPARDARFLSYLKSAHIKAILVERDWKPAWIGILPKLGFKGKPIEGIVFYPLGPCITSCRSARHHHHTAGHTA
jgi:hypothetical protein